jgi:hypothetical protein
MQLSRTDRELPIRSPVAAIMPVSLSWDGSPSTPQLSCGCYGIARETSYGHAGGATQAAEHSATSPGEPGGHRSCVRLRSVARSVGDAAGFGSFSLGTRRGAAAGPRPRMIQEALGIESDDVAKLRLPKNMASRSPMMRARCWRDVGDHDARNRASV